MQNAPENNFSLLSTRYFGILNFGLRGREGSVARFSPRRGGGSIASFRTESTHGHPWFQCMGSKNNYLPKFNGNTNINFNFCPDKFL